MSRSLSEARERSFLNHSWETMQKLFSYEISLRIPWVMTFQERERRHTTAVAHSQRSLPVYFIASVAAIGGLLFGYDTGVISGALLFLKQSFALNATTQEIAVSAVLVGAIIGAIVAGRLNDALGRKKTLLLLAVIFTAGALLTAISPNLVFFLVCRIIVGLAIGAAASVVSTVAQSH